MIKLELSKRDQKDKQDQTKFDSYKDEQNAKISTIEIRIGKFNTKQLELTKKMEDSITMQGPSIASIKDDDEDKKRDERIKTKYEDISEKIDRVAKEFQALQFQSKTNTTQVDNKIVNKADIDMVKKLESTCLCRQNI